MNPGDVSAVVVRWRGGTEVERCLGSLLELDDAPAEIVLVDSGSGDGGAERLGRLFSAVRIEALDSNPGFAGAADHGVSVTGSPLVLLLNPDTEVLGGALQSLADHLGANPGTAGVVPLLENPDGSTQHRWQLRHLPTWKDLAVGRPGRAAFGRAPDRPVGVAQPAAAAWMIRREAWDALGGLDRSYFPAWWEDVDFCTRLDRRLNEPGFPWNQGWHVVPDARIRHLGGSSVAGLGRRAFLEAYHRNLLRYARIHHPDRLPVIRRGLRLSLIVRGILRPSRFVDCIRVSGSL